MYWLMVGCSHHRTPVNIREKLAFSPAQVADALGRFGQQFPDTEAVLLSTCNRVELYAANQRQPHLPTKERVAEFLANYHGMPTSDLLDQLVDLRDAEAIQHLFLVSSSLDSMVVGEAQILSQVKQAYELACTSQTTGTLTHVAFQRAAVVAKRVANETSIHRRRVSIPSVAVSEIASEFFEHFHDKEILLIGAGEMGTETLRYLIDAGAKRIAIVNRSADRGEELARQFSAAYRPWSDLYPSIAQADLIVSTTSSSEPIVQLDRFREIHAKRRPSAVLILDLAVPRDFDPKIAELPDVYLYSLDDVQQVCDRNRRLREEQLPKAEKIVAEEARALIADMAHRETAPTLQRLREQAEKIKREELERLLSKLQPKNLDEATRRELATSFDRLVNKLLHPPMQSLREQAGDTGHASLLEALRRLFQLGD